MTSKIDRLQLITTFLAVAEHGNLSAAARTLGSTQPTVSRRLRDLEALLGTRLASRTTHRFHLTPEGVELQRKATAWSDVWSEWEHGLKASTLLPQGKLTLVGPHGYGSRLLIDAIALFRRAHPQVEVSLQLTDRTVDLVSQGADCWIYAGGVRDQNLHVRRRDQDAVHHPQPTDVQVLVAHAAGVDPAVRTLADQVHRAVRELQ